ncbi:hypothetical protein [Amaricoccus tamworthensis]|uniref:hypothetical protein n=1 Tax=Amaricoccus tamworthensis TaxID=57002 RepID=UPI003C7A9120
MRRRLVPAIVYLALVINMAVVPAVLALSTREPVDGEPVLLIVPPGGDAAHVAAVSGGIVLANSRVSSVALTYSPDRNYFEILSNNGALMLLNGSLSDLFCTTG